MLRFAVSPTNDMHIEDFSTCLLTYIVAKQRDENFIVRMKDIDKKNTIEGKDQEILDILDVFGIAYAQVSYQSQNHKFYAAMALQLLHEKKAFSCFCSDDWLANKRQEAKDANKPYLYDDACRNLPPELVIDNTNPFTIRIVRPDKAIVIHDLIKGKMSFSPETLDSFIIMNQDKTPTSDFACAVDDMLNDISFIIRSDTQLNNTAQQEHIRESLDYKKEIQYAHLPSIKSDGTIPGIKGLLELGYLPEAISNYLISLHADLPEEIFTLEEAIDLFSPDQLSHRPAQFDIERLNYINKQHLKNMDAKELSRYVGFADAEIGELARIYLDEVDTTVALRSKIAPIFQQRNIPREFEEKSILMIAAIKKAPYFEAYNDFKNHISAVTGLQEDELLDILRLLLTNDTEGPDLSDIYKYIKNYLGEIIK